MSAYIVVTLPLELENRLNLELFSAACSLCVDISEYRLAGSELRSVKKQSSDRRYVNALLADLARVHRM